MVNGNLTITSGIFDCNNFNIEIQGDWVNNDSFVQGTGSVTFDGTGSQSITNSSEETFYDFIINKESGELSLEDNIIISNTFSMNAGKIIIFQ